MNHSFDKTDEAEYYYNQYYQQQQQEQEDSSSSPTRHARGAGKRRSQRSKLPFSSGSKEDPLLDYDERHPFGMSVDYKYEYHKSQHMDGTGKELVDVICENLYKRTGMNGNKVDELAISRKVIERKGDSPDDEETGESDGQLNGNGHERSESGEERDGNEPKSSDKVCHLVKKPDNRIKVCSSSSNKFVSRRLPPPPLSAPLPKSLINFYQRPRFKRERMVIPPRMRINVEPKTIEDRWREYKKQAKYRKRSSSIDNYKISLWYELNKN